MGKYKLEKDLIFYHAGEPGAVFTFSAGNLMNETMLKETLNHLKYDAERRVDWVEERRKIPRF